MEMMNSMMAQQQPTLSIDQLLRAAKLIEQRAIEKLMVVNQPIELLGTQFSVGPSSMGFSTKLGEDYQERLLASKIRSVLAEPGAYAAPNSTGSSRRSSPISVSSAPNSPETSNAGGMLVGQQPMATTSMLDQHPANIRVHSSASTTSSNGCANGRRVSGSRQSRAAHNELEKNRRANLRGHLEALKSVLPPEADSHRDTTLSLLTRARNYIRFLKDQKSSLADKRASLLAEHLRLRELLQQGGSAAQAVTEAAELPAPKPVFLREQPEHVVEAPQQQQQQVVHAEDKTPSTAEEAAKQPSLEFLAMHGLLPALPLLYPYSSAGLGHSPAGSPALC